MQAVPSFPSPDPFVLRPLLLLATVLSLSATGALSTPGVAQVPPDSTTTGQAAGADAVAAPPAYDEFEGRIAPSGAFLRAVLFPGWGHAAIGVHGRGGFYLATQAVVGWSILRSRTGLRSARDLVRLRSAPIERDLAEQGVTDPFEIEEVLADDEGVLRARGLENSRQQQFEDWLALGIFTVLLSGADAFVSAHLQPFPADVEVGVVPVGDEGRVEMRVQVPVGGPGRR